MKLLFQIFWLVTTFVSVYGFKVLAVLPFGSNSHFAVGSSIVKALHKAGHEVTVISPYPHKKPLEKWRDVSTADILKKQIEGNKKKS
jgi:hypothetical protein